ncbi:hypothetical protein OFB92_35720, partial [Escherichia coli]|nr:hypothetical protein [Escherichia coli]
MSPFWRRYAHHEPKPLDISKMTAAGRFFLGQHDFTAFCSAQSDGENRIRNITGFSIESQWDARAQAL